VKQHELFTAVATELSGLIKNHLCSSNGVVGCGDEERDTANNWPRSAAESLNPA
jgi:hypothetical protein